MNSKTVIWLIEYLKIRLMEINAVGYRPGSSGRMLADKIDSVIEELQKELNRIENEEGEEDLSL